MPLPTAPTTFADTATSASAPSRSTLGARLRTIHAYLGVLIAPLILFLAATGLIQVYGLHEASDDYKPWPVIEKLGMLHKDQAYKLGHHRPAAAAAATPLGDAAPARGENAAPAPPAAADAHDEHAEHEHDEGPDSNFATALLKAWFAAVACFLVVSTLLGLWIACRHPTRRLQYLVLFGVGVIVPTALAVLGS